MDKIEQRAINKLKKGACIITDSDYHGAVISGHGADMKISNPVFLSLEHKNLIHQQHKWPFYYVLSE